jgi:hypothetical protein
MMLATMVSRFLLRHNYVGPTLGAFSLGGFLMACASVIEIFIVEGIADG